MSIRPQQVACTVTSWFDPDASSNEIQPYYSGALRLSPGEPGLITI